MHKTTTGQEKQGEWLSVIAGLEPGAIQTVLLERAKQAALTMAVALLEQDAEGLCGGRYRRKGTALCHRGGSEATSVVLEGARVCAAPPARTKKQPRDAVADPGEAAEPRLAGSADAPTHAVGGEHAEL